MKRFIVGIASIAVGLAAQAELEGSEDTGTFGKWVVARSIDKTNNEVVCIGIHDENYETQLTSNALFIGVEGGIKNITLYFEKATNGTKRSAKFVERMSDTVIIDEDDFKKALSSN